MDFGGDAEGINYELGFFPKQMGRKFININTINLYSEKEDLFSCLFHVIFILKCEILNEHLFTSVYIYRDI